MLPRRSVSSSSDTPYKSTETTRPHFGEMTEGQMSTPSVHRPHRYSVG